MRRRDFIKTIAGSTAIWPFAARAQQGGRMRRVGILMPFSPSDKEMQDRVQALKKELQNRGWTAGVDVQFDERWTTDNMDLVRANAANLVELKPDVIVAIGGRVIPAIDSHSSDHHSWLLLSRRSRIYQKPRAARWQRDGICDAGVVGHR